MNITPVAASLTPRRRRRRPARVGEAEVIETMRQLRVCMRTVLHGRTIEHSAGLAAVSTNTLGRIMRGENVTLATVARIIGRLGGRLIVRIEPSEHDRNATCSHN